MGWIKRNLFFVIGGGIALLLLGAAAYYDYQSWNHNSTALARLNEIYSTLKQLGDQKLSPGNAKINNIQTAKDQEQEVREWIKKSAVYFVPIKAIPDLPDVTSEAFANALRQTIDQLQHQAEAASVQLPPQYYFSFQAQRFAIQFTSGSPGPLAVQLGEVKSISEILFAAHVNAIDGIQRVRVSEDDTKGPQTDYLADDAVTNDQAVLTPFAVTFRGFSSELASVLAGFASSPHGFIVSAVNVAPAGTASQTDDSGTAAPEDVMQMRYRNFRGRDRYAPPVMQQAPPVLTSRGGLPTVLKEQLLRVTLEVKIVKPKK
jgi:hypothetical protein